MAGILKKNRPPVAVTPKAATPGTVTKKKVAAPGSLSREKRKAFKAREGLNRMQSRALQQREQADIKLGGIANEMLPEVRSSYEQPFDFSQLPSQAVSGDFNDWRNQQIDQSYNLFSSRFEPEFARQRDDFEQQMYNQGIPVGSERYNSLKTQMERAQNDAKQAALVNAQGIAGQNAGQFFDISTQARGNALNEGLLKRGMPLAEMQALYGAQSGMGQQNLAHNQALAQQQQQADLQLRNAQQMPRGGGGNAAWQQYGFSSPMEYDAYKTQQDRDNFLWMQQNAPKQKQPSPYPSLIGNVIGSGLQGYLSSL